MDAHRSPPVAEIQGKPSLLWIARLVDVRALAVVAFLMGAAVVLAHRPFSDISMGDEAIYDYIAQSIVRGQIPYRDVIDPKTPGSMYFSAAAMAVGNLFGVRDVLAVRALNVLMMGLLAALIFLVAESYFRSRVAGALAFLIPLVFDPFSTLMTRGTQPKLPMMLFGMLSLLLIAKDKPFWAGFCSMLSFLCWQPGLMFTGVALLIFSRYLTSWRDLRALKVAIGAAVPLAVMILYFLLRGALDDLWSWTMVFPYSVFAPETLASVGESLGDMEEVMQRRLDTDFIFAQFALVGLIVFIAGRAWRIFKGREKFLSEDLFRDAIVYPPIIYLAFSAMNFQSGGDLIPFFPFIGLFAAYLLFEVCRLLARAWSKLEIISPLAAILVVCLLIVIRCARFDLGEETLEGQYQEAQVLESFLGPDDKIYVHGVGEALVLLNRPNLNKYIAFDSGADDFIAAQKPGGFQDVIDEIEMHQPKVVVAARMRNVRHQKELKQWLREHYERLEYFKLKGVFIRKHGK